MILSCGCAVRQLDFVHKVIDEKIGGRTTIGDIDGDGKSDVVLSHSEKTGFSIMWYAAVNPKAGKDGWKRYEVDVIDYRYTLRAEDMDLDGDIDIVTAKSWDKAPIQLWCNTIKD